MFKQYYEVIEEFNSKKDYGIEIRKPYDECLSVLKKGEKVLRQLHILSMRY